MGEKISKNMINFMGTNPSEKIDKFYGWKNFQKMTNFMGTNPSEKTDKFYEWKNFQKKFPILSVETLLKDAVIVHDIHFEEKVKNLYPKKVVS